jgi:hypothetical protein
MASALSAFAAAVWDKKLVSISRCPGFLVPFCSGNPAAMRMIKLELTNTDPIR